MLKTKIYYFAKLDHKIVGNHVKLWKAISLVKNHHRQQIMAEILINFFVNYVNNFSIDNILSDTTNQTNKVHPVSRVIEKYANYLISLKVNKGMSDKENINEKKSEHKKESETIKTISNSVDILFSCTKV